MSKNIAIVDRFLGHGHDLDMKMEDRRPIERVSVVISENTHNVGLVILDLTPNLGY
jgi:hypothetical protein